MNLSLLLQLCGVPLTIGLIVISAILTIVSLLLYFRTRKESLLTAFFPLTFLPVAAGLASTVIDMVSSIGLQMDPDYGAAMEPVFLLQVGLVPLLAGALASAPPMIVTAAGRWLLAWKASGFRLTPEPKPKVKTAVEIASEEREAMTRDADKYLEQIIRPR
ncbi:hypothetical protein [Stieleria varia]|uniref:MotA/TolQ/ExbB proton channel domain-containing protein n=1 Tax=Stieleria varia TaxID=2528005 RepID=A0A5C5ZXZ8_9BACT|nr:hypothetical protein [Stieleria varia]TWT92030.1 hypothetical protein Pla52n_63260 [Stieleria varia]